MPIKELTLDEAGTRLILEHRQNVRDRLQNYIDILQDASSSVWTAQLVVSAALTIGNVYTSIRDDRNKYNSLDSDLDASYTSYAASAWKTDLDADVTALNGLLNWLVTQFNNTFTAVDPADTYLIKQLTSGQKTAFANRLITELG